MRIAFLYGTMHRGGAERVIASLANFFSTQNDDVSVITLDNDPSGYALEDRVKHIRLNLSGNSRNKLDGLRRNIRIINRLRSELNKGNYELVVTFSIRLAILLQYAFPFRRKFKIVASERGNPNVLRLGKLEKVQYKYLLPNVDGFVFQTERVSLCYPESVRKSGMVIHNGVFRKILPNEITPFEKRRHKEICAIGRLCEQKGYDILIEAFHMFQKNHPDYQLHIFGEGSLKCEIERQIKKMDVHGVTLHGSVSNVMFQVEDMGMFVLSSRYEGMPNALMEAMACGIPCIATDCDFGPGELIRDGENGLLVGVDDAVGLCNAMSRIADDAVLAKKLSSESIKIRNTHDGKKIAERYREYFFEVMNEN